MQFHAHEIVFVGVVAPKCRGKSIGVGQLQDVDIAVIVQVGTDYAAPLLRIVEADLSRPIFASGVRVEPSPDRVENVAAVRPCFRIRTTVAGQDIFNLSKIRQRSRLRQVIELGSGIATDHCNQAIDVFELQVLPISSNTARQIIAEYCVGNILDDAAQPILIAILS